jgi:hypothetical protein
MRADIHDGQERSAPRKGRIQKSKTSRSRSADSTCNARPVHTAGHKGDCGFVGTNPWQHWRLRAVATKGMVVEDLAVVASVDDRDGVCPGGSEHPSGYAEQKEKPRAALIASIASSRPKHAGAACPMRAPRRHRPRFAPQRGRATRDADGTCHGSIVLPGSPSARHPRTSLQGDKGDGRIDQQKGRSRCPTAQH